MTKPDILMMGAYPQWDMDDLEQRYRLFKVWEADDRDALIAAAAGSVRAIATRGELGASAELMAKLPNLEIVSCYGVGTDAIDLAYAKSRGIRVTNTPDVLTGDVADIAIGLSLAICRQIREGHDYVLSGQWAKANMGLVTRFFGKKVGIAGMGRVGAATAKRAAGFDCDIRYFDTQARDDLPWDFEPDLKALAAWADFLIVTIAGGPSTFGIINADVLAALGPDSYLINVSRGTTVDEPALLAALESKVIKGAALDVFHNEPRIDPRFLTLPNALLQPHHASGTVETRKAMGQLVRDNLAAHFAGKPLITPVV